MVFHVVTQVGDVLVTLRAMRAVIRFFASLGMKGLHVGSDES